MEKPDANGFVKITWPSRNIPHGGIFHSRVVQPSAAHMQFLKVLLEESKLSIAQRQKTAWDLRQENEKEERQPRVQMPVVRPRTSRRRSLSAIRESGVLEIEPYRPIKRGEDREKLKDKLANFMAYGDSPEQVLPAPPRLDKLQPKLPTPKEMRNELLTQIRERAEWLAEMEDLGQAEPHREIIKDQIAERLRSLDALGVDSECSSTRSSASRVGTSRSKESRDQKYIKTVGIIAKSKDSAALGEKQKSARSAKHQGKEENVATYNELPKLQYSPRRRV